jgi:hypothetical protein
MIHERRSAPANIGAVHTTTGESSSTRIAAASSAVLGAARSAIVKTQMGIWDETRDPGTLELDRGGDGMIWQWFGCIALSALAAALSVLIQEARQR